MAITIILACIGSTGLFSFVQFIITTIIESRKPSHEQELLLAIAHDRICFLCSQAIEKQYITQDEYDNILQLYIPYREAGGNHLAKRYFEEVDKLPIRN